MVAAAGDVGFHKGRPLAAMVIFRCCLQWKAFQADRTSLFDKIINTMGSQVGGGCNRDPVNGVIQGARQCVHAGTGVNPRT